MDRAQKAETVESLKGVFAGAGVVVVGHYTGLTVAELTVLRSRLRSEGAALKVVKNRLVKLAIDGTAKSAAADLFTAPRQSLTPLTRLRPQGRRRVREGKGKVRRSRRAVRRPIARQSRRAGSGHAAFAGRAAWKIIGLVQAPATKIAGVLAAPGGQLARVLNAYATKDAA